MTFTPDLSVNIAGIRLKNPVITASGTFGYGREFERLVDLNRLGAIIVKGLSLRPSAGNPPPRIVETPCGMLNAIGLENVGLDAFIRDKLPFLKKLSTPVFVNIYGKKAEDYGVLAKSIDALPEIAAIEVNISCPNVQAGGLAFGVDPVCAREVVARVRKNSGKPLIVKLTPNVTDIGEIARSVESAGADAVSLINTITGMAIDIHTRRSRLANVTGGLSGPAIRPVALRMVWQAVRNVRIPVIGIGGIRTAADALEFLIAGASAIQVGTANFIDPGATMKIIDGLEAFLREKEIPRISEIVGTLVI